METPWDDRVAQYLAGRYRVTVQQVCRGVGIEYVSSHHYREIAIAMKNAGWHHAGPGCGCVVIWEAGDKPKADETAMAFLNRARDYADAANELFAVSETRPRVHPEHRPLSSPLSLLYFHTVELGLEAFLRAHDSPIEGTSRRSHDLTKLYEECRKLGLVVDRDDSVALGKIVTLLESGDRQGFRYFSSGSAVTADLAWTREFVEHFMVVIAREVEKCDPNALLRRRS